VRQRNAVSLTQWAAYIANSTPPTPCPDSWVQQRIVAESIPLQLDSMTTQTIAYFLQDPNTLSNILEMISEDNDTPTENTLSDTNSGICSAFMPRFGAATVTADQIATWRTNNNVPAVAAEAKKN
jgi:hypothetical protein